MTSPSLIRVFLALYLVLFFGYLLSPLIIMGITAFNSPGFPRATPFECLTFEWFVVLMNDQRIVNSIKNSFIVGAGTVVLSVVMGLAAALVLTQIWPKLRATFYTITIAPILIPGVVLGISTLVFWDRVNVMLGLPTDSFLYNGLFLTIIGQSTFIASYCMLIFIARLQRFDPVLTEAALDLGASHVQAFRKVLLPFLLPAILSSAVIAFLASFENYNTTTFTFGEYPTLTIELAQKVRYGINPSISALAVLIVGLTVLFALTSEAYNRRQQIAKANGAPDGALKSMQSGVPGFFQKNPAAIALTVLVLGFGSTFVFSQVYSPATCKRAVKEQKRIEAQKRIQELRLKQQQRARDRAIAGPNIFDEKSSKVKVPKATAPSKTPKNPDSGFGGVFNPGNLKQ